jgi:tetraacyldisaccharide 4'-kinase
VPVICIGNLVAGGSGKTPVVLSLAARLAGMGKPVHVVSRGYGGRLAGPVRVDASMHDAGAVGDEPLLLAGRAPCWVARDRAAGVAAAVAAGAEIVLLDDGFQNPSIDKDCGLLVVDAEYGFGNGRVIPAGPLREPIEGGLARATAIVLLGDGAEPSELHRAGAPVLRAALAPVHPATPAGPLFAFAGIGRPEKFFATLRLAGAPVTGARSFLDHHRYTEAEIGRLRRDAERAGAGLITTAKDWVRLPQAWRDGIAVLDVEIRWRDEAAIDDLLADVLRCRNPGRNLGRNPDGYGRSAAGG